MTASEHIDKQIASYGDWRSKMLTKLRKLVHEVDSEIVEEWKWDTAVFVHNGMVCAVSGFKEHVKINFFKGAQLKDPHKLINNGLESKSHRSIDFSDGDILNESHLKDLIKQAVVLNTKKG
jgi:hypothetical protein